MKKRAQDILRKEKVFVGLEDSKKTWQLCVRNGGVIVHETSMPAKFEVLQNYFNNQVPGVSDPSDIRGRLQGL